MTEMAGIVVLNTEESSGMVIAKDDKDSRIFFGLVLTAVTDSLYFTSTLCKSFVNYLLQNLAASVLSYRCLVCFLSF